MGGGSGRSHSSRIRNRRHRRPMSTHTVTGLGGGRCVRPDMLQGSAVMTSGELAIVIAGTHEDWSGGARTLTRARVQPNGTLSFGAELEPDGDHVWFRTEENAVGRMPAATPADRGRRLVDALTWSGSRRNRQLEPGINRFEGPDLRGRRRVARTPGVVKMGSLAGDPRPAGERTTRVLAGYRRTAGNRGRGQARPFGAADLAADPRHMPAATTSRPRQRVRGLSPGSSSRSGDAPEGGERAGPTSTTRSTAAGCSSPSAAGRRTSPDYA